jgi:hypothetical protein
LAGGASTDDRALEISASIIGAHNRRVQVLSGEHYQSLRTLLTALILWLRSAGDYAAVVAWCEVLVSLLAENIDERGACAALLVTKCDALIHLGRMPDAVAVATEAFVQVRNTRTVLMRFRAIMHAESSTVSTAPECIGALREMLQVAVSDDTSSVGTGVTENLARIVLACNIAQAAEQLAPSTRN